MTSAALEVYNQNIFGVGHEISFRFVGHLQRQPYMGLETFYKINNIRGKFVNISAGYMNTYKNEGYTFILNKPFITPSIKWGYGASALRMFRTDRIFEDDPIITSIPMDLSFYSAWAGRSFQIKPNDIHNSQMMVSAGFYNRTYFQRPIPSPIDNQYFSNKELKLLENISFMFQDAKADTMVESTHLINEPWDRTLKEKGEFKKIDYMRAVDSDIVSLSYDEVKERTEERSEMVKIFGAD